jgi:DNA-binding Lrp family transcriptional regulator
MVNTLSNKILYLLEKDSRLSDEEISVLLKISEQEVHAEIEKLKSQQIICGFGALIDWDKTDKEYVTALIEVKVTPQRGQGFDNIAERIYRFDEVKAVYLMSGGFDLTVLIEGHTIKEVAHFISDKLAPLESVLSTATHFVLKKYKDHGVILKGVKLDDERMIVSP